MGKSEGKSEGKSSCGAIAQSSADPNALSMAVDERTSVVTLAELFQTGSLPISWLILGFIFELIFELIFGLIFGLIWGDAWFQSLTNGSSKLEL